MSDTLLMLFSYQPSKGACSLDELPHLNWRRFAAHSFAASVNRGKKGGPFVLATALAMRAGDRGWDDDFRRWGVKAHELGDVNKELLRSSMFRALSVKLLKEERLYASSRRFRIEFEESFGYPVSRSPLFLATKEEL